MEDWLKYLVCFILGWIITLMMGEGYKNDNHHLQYIHKYLKKIEKIINNCKVNYKDNNNDNYKCKKLMANVSEEECNLLGIYLKLWDENYGSMFCTDYATCGMPANDNRDPITGSRCENIND